MRMPKCLCCEAAQFGIFLYFYLVFYHHTTQIPRSWSNSKTHATQTHTHTKCMNEKSMHASTKTTPSIINVIYGEKKTRVLTLIRTLYAVWHKLKMWTELFGVIAIEYKMYIAHTTPRSRAQNVIFQMGNLVKMRYIYFNEWIKLNTSSSNGGGH